MISVFTPTHNTRFMAEVYDSLVQQTIPDWEWIVLLNGRANEQELPDVMRRDERVRIHHQYNIQGVGEAKARCIELSRGDYFLELDHDDLLLPHALQETLSAFDKGASFVYSNTLRMTEEGEPEFTEYNLLHGWQYRTFSYRNKTYKECLSFGPTPQAMSYIWYMPNHLRAFTREIYHRSGGYDRNLQICDDQHLMQRMYISDASFAHLAKPLYLQRIHQSQTQVVLNRQIQEQTVQLYKQHINDIALSWAKQQNLLALDMGAAHRKQPGFLGVDMYAAEGVDIVCDCNHRLPFDDNSVGVIRAVDFMEHIKDPVHLMNEFYRVLAHGGMLLSMTPSTDGRGAFQDPTHVSFWNENSFWYYTRQHIKNFVPAIKARFQPSFIETGFPNDFCREHNIAYVTANLSAVKEGERLPGVLEV